MNGFRLLKCNFGEISPSLHKISIRQYGIGPRNTNRVKQNGRLLEKNTIYMTDKSLCSFSRTFRSTLGRNVLIPLRVSTSRCLCTTHDGFCLSFEEFRSLIESKDIQIIDVREPEEIEQEGSIPDTVNIPLGKLKMAFKMDENIYLQTYKVPKPEKYDANIVFVGLGPIKSSAARAIAYNHGYKYGMPCHDDFNIRCRSISNILNELSSALSLPPDKFQALYSLDISEPEDNRLVFSCRSGVRSSMALTMALELGFINSRHYGGGYSEWSEKMKSKKD